MKIISVVGARPNFMKIAPFIRAIDTYNASTPCLAGRQALRVVRIIPNYLLEWSREIRQFNISICAPVRIKIGYLQLKERFVTFNVCSQISEK